MCGIAGFVVKEPSGVASRWAASAEAALQHRGPDESRCVSFFPDLSHTFGIDERAVCTLVHKRLSIIDLSPGGSQPRVSANGRFVLAFNGEIYNYRELRAQLEREAGTVFSSQSDSEVLIEAWATWGEACLPRLIGMYAFAVVDVKERTLTLARDPVGVKPLFWVNTAHGTAYASEPAVLLDWPGVQRTVNPQALADYLRFGFTDHLSESLFADVAHVPAGHTVTVALDDPGHTDFRHFWVPEIRTPDPLGFEESVSRLRGLMTASIELHLRADVPVASCLSGGVDSSSIVSLMRHVGGTGLDIHTFSHVARGTPFDEEGHMDTVNAAFGTVPHKIVSTPDDLARELPCLIRSQQAPFATTSIFAQYRVFQAIHAAGLKVVLDGQGADELFGGYGFHIGARIASHLKAGRWGAARSLAAAANGKQNLSTRTHWSNAFDYLLPPWAKHGLRRLSGRAVLPVWMDAAWCQRHGVAPDPYRTATTPMVLKEAVVRSLKGPGLPHLLRYEDHNSMAFSVESRVPFLSQPVIDFALGLPEDHLVSDDGTTKAVLRAAMRGIVPDSILDRTDKVAFQTPEDTWMRALAPWIEEQLGSEDARRIGALDVGQAREQWRKVMAGGASYGPFVWRWANAVSWSREFDVSSD